MDYSFYIIKQNTPESKLLSIAGIDRATLKIVKWKGKKKMNGGFGRSPVEWKVEGTDNVEGLCKTIISVLGKRKILTAIENHALTRAIKTIEGIQNANTKIYRDSDFKNQKKSIIKSHILYMYPSLSKSKVDFLANYLSEKSFNTIQELIQAARNELIEIKPIEDSQTLFSIIMDIQ